MLDSGKPMEDIAQWLKGKDIKFAAGTATRSAEQIPLELLPKIHPLKVGQGLILQSPQTVTVMRLAAAQSAPVSEEAALATYSTVSRQSTRDRKPPSRNLKHSRPKPKLLIWANSLMQRPAAASQPAASHSSRTQRRCWRRRKSSASTTDIAVEKGIAGLK